MTRTFSAYSQTDSSQINNDLINSYLYDINTIDQKTFEKKTNQMIQSIPTYKLNDIILPLNSVTSYKSNANVEYILGPKYGLTEDGMNETKSLINDNFLEDVKRKRKLNGPSQFDSRIEIRDLNPNIAEENKILQNSKSVGIIIERNNLSQVSDSLFHLDLGANLGQLYNLCEKEAFRNQPVAGIGTAFIIDKQQMMTASHVFSGPLDSYAIVFGFQMINKVGTFNSYIDSKNIYFPQKVTFTSDEFDILTFKVDRPLDREAIQIETLPTIKDTEIYMIGHPMGLPQKAAVNARVYDLDHPDYFYTTLDAFQGNSGSPVFNANTHHLIGVLVSGELDYRWNGQCNETTLCKLPYCKGEKVIRIDRVLSE